MWVRAGVSFVVVFLFAFVLGGWFLMPHLAPVPDHPITVFEMDYWTINWAGAVLGLVLGTLSAWSVLRKARKTQAAGGSPTRA